MKKILMMFIAIIAFSIISNGEEQILLWQVGERSWTGGSGAIVYDTDNTPYAIATFVDRNTINGSQDADADAGIDYGIQVKCIKGDTTVYIDTHLGFGEQYGYGDYEDFGWSGPKNAMPIADIGSGAYETGFMQSRMKSDEYGYDIRKDEGWKIAAELGRMEWNEDFTDYQWTLLAETEMFDVDSSIFSHVYETMSLSPSGNPWEPNRFFAIPDVPEPNSFILLSLGICLLGLRRKTFG